MPIWEAQGGREVPPCSRISAPRPERQAGLHCAAAEPAPPAQGLRVRAAEPPGPGECEAVRPGGEQSLPGKALGPRGRGATLGRREPRVSSQGSSAVLQAPETRPGGGSWPAGSRGAGPRSQRQETKGPVGSPRQGCQPWWACEGQLQGPELSSGAQGPRGQAGGWRRLSCSLLAVTTQDGTARAGPRSLPPRGAHRLRAALGAGGLWELPGPQSRGGKGRGQGGSSPEGRQEAMPGRPGAVPTARAGTGSGPGCLAAELTLTSWHLEGTWQPRTRAPC